MQIRGPNLGGRISLLFIGLLIGLSATAVTGHATASTTPQQFTFEAVSGPANAQATLFSSTPGIPTGWKPVSNATVELTSDGAGAWGTANGTSAYVGECVFSLGCGGAGFASSQTIEPFSAALNTLNNGNVQCSSPPFDTSFAYGVSLLTLTAGSSVRFDVQSDDGFEVYISPAGASLSWTAVFGGNGWIGQGITDYSNSLSLSAGDYLVVIEWFNSCGPGVLAVQFSNLPAGSTFAASQYGIPQPPAKQTLNTCELDLYCSTSALVFSTRSAGATVTVYSASSPTEVGVTSSSAVTTGICSLPDVNGTLFGCSMGETGQFIVVSGVTYAYTVTFSDGKTATGTIVIPTPWTVEVLSVPSQ